MIANREGPQARMYCAAEHKQFFFAEQPAGCFEDQLPLSSGQYRYMPLDGPGHHHLIKALASSGPQRCYYVSERRHYFMVLNAASGVLLVHAHTHTPYEA